MTLRVRMRALLMALIEWLNDTAGFIDYLIVGLLIFLAATVPMDWF